MEMWVDTLRLNNFKGHLYDTIYGSRLIVYVKTTLMNVQLAKFCPETSARRRFVRVSKLKVANLSRLSNNLKFYSRTHIYTPR